MREQAASDPWAIRLLIALGAAFVGFIIRAIYDGVRDRRKASRRDAQVLSALRRELAVMRGFIKTSRDLLHHELELLEQTNHQRWLLSPLTPLPTNVYDLVRSDPPSALLEGHTLSALALAAANASHANALQEVRQTWKSGSWVALGETLEKYDRMLVESLGNVERYVDQVLAVLPPEAPNGARSPE